MADEPTQAPETETQDTPTNDAASTQQETPAPESTEDSTPVTDWEQRYNSLRPEYDRSNQLLAAARGEHGPEAQAQALQQFGVELDSEEEQEPENDEWVDPDDRIDRLEQQLAERQQREEEAEFERLESDFIDQTLSKIQEDENVTLSKQERKFVETNALANRLDNGEPNLQGAFDDLKGIKSAARDEYRSSKTAPKAPVGTAGEDTIDSSDKEARNKWMAEDLAARMAADSEGS